MILNHQLFSAVYLRELGQGRQAADVVDASRLTIREWRENYPLLEDANRRDYVKQCLSALGAASMWRAENDGFVLYTDTSRQTAAGLCLLTDEADLGRACKGAHPQAMLIRELRKASLRWGMLTNGAQWRLCRADAPAPYEVFLNADLDALLALPSLREFGLFHQFFGGQAWGETVVAAPKGKPTLPARMGLDRFADASEQRTGDIERHLKSQVEPILQKLCLGFVHDAGADEYDANALQTIYENAIYLLYRILFLFYAEARELLPLGSAVYAPHSLAGMVGDVLKRQREGIVDADAYSLWKRLTRLFVIVDEGDADLGVAAYNGGLFSDEEKPYLKSHKIRDEYLSPALFALAYAALVPIDYRDLSVRHLGTLYEGLLEYRLNRVAGQPRVVREAGGKRTFVPVNLAGPIRRGETVMEPGSVYFADDKGERKSSGSYYTPEDAVQYIVANTVTPKLHERREPLDLVLERIEQERANAISDDERQQLERLADKEILDAVENSLLRLRVLDPAMGSGHFLVAAAQIITNFIVETLNATPWPNPQISTDPLMWKRRVVERCLYGVDKNPLAQELAKLSLWIASASVGKPLTFLDHHLKIGNSLYGTPLARLAAPPHLAPKPATKTQDATASIFDALDAETMQGVLAGLAEITQTDSDSIEAVKHKGEVSRAVNTRTERLRMVADVWLATLFGLKTAGGRAITGDEYAQILGHATRNYAPETWHKIVADSPILQNARTIAERESFLHWELEFADAVVDGICRFDAVIANPPYVGTKANTAITALYATAKSNDLYAWLFEKALVVMGEGSTVGMIVPLSVMFGWEMEALRNLLLKAEFSLRISCYDNVPEGLFNTGKISDNTSKENMQRTAIILAQRSTGVRSVNTTGLLRWWCQDRPILFQSLRYADVTEYCTSEYIPHIGDERLSMFWARAKQTSRCIDTISREVMYEGRKPKPDDICLTIPRAVGYFISATPGFMARSKTLSATFINEQDRDLARVLINSNVFFWYWRSVGDGFLLGVDVIKNFPVPDLSPDDTSFLSFAKRLDGVQEECTTFKMYRGEKIPSFNFNKRMDILLDIDDWIVKHVAPDLNLPRDIFAQYKSNSFLRPLDLSALAVAEEESGE